MLMKKLKALMVATMIFATGVTVYQTAIASPMIVAEATGNKFGLETSMDASGNITFGNQSAGITSQTSVWEKVFSVLNTVVQAVGGIGTTLMVLFFILNFIKLGQNSANASEVAKIKSAMLWNGIAAAGLGSVTLVFSLFFYMFQK